MALKKNDIQPVRQRKYLAKDFDGLRAQILDYVQTYYPDKLADFSESSLGGLFLDMAAYVGDNMSFYLDHQYGEINYETAVETRNIEKHLRTAGVPIVGSSPATVPVTIYIEVPADSTGKDVREDCLPIIKQGSIFTTGDVDFVLLEDVDFSKKKSDGEFVASKKIGSQNSNQKITSYLMAQAGICISGAESADSFVIGSNFVPFRQITLSNSNVTEIINVIDSLGNIYYEVKALTHDVVYKNVTNTAKDNEIVPESLKVIPAPYRFITNTDINSRNTTLTFGGGNANTFNDDIIPDPSEFAISFPYTKTFSRLSINPQKLLQTNTLGVAATDVTINITYRHGGGLNHNVPVDAIRNIKTIETEFPGNPPFQLALAVRSSIQVSNLIPSSGGEDAPEIDDLKNLIPSVKNSQERIVTKEDMLARVYTLPSNFGRVFRAAVRSNPNNPLATQLFIVSRTPDQKLLTVSSDTLKQNLVKYLDPYRMISDSIDILDARVINLSMQFNAVVDPSLNKTTVLQQAILQLQNFFNIRNFYIDQPIIISEVINAIFTINGILSVDYDQFKLFKNVTGVVNNRTYCDQAFDVESNISKGVIIPPPGGIFEIRYPEVDIVGKAI